jgi:hypothetical protein
MHKIDLILKERANRKTRSSWSYEAYYKKDLRTERLLEEIEGKIKSRNCIQEARKQFITSQITSFEVYFKDTFLTLLETFGNEKFTKEIKQKFDITELNRIIEEGISINEIISSNYNFQDLDQINKAFSIALGINLFEEIKKRKFTSSPKLTPFKVHKEFYKELQQYIQLRHDFVHDINFKKNITHAQLERYLDIRALFVLAVAIIVSEKMDENARKVKEKK